MAAALPSIRAEGYASHALHSADRHWPTSNCHVDLWIEVLSSLGHDPCAALGFTVRLDFEGDQFTFAKVPSGDLDLLFGIDVQELVVYRSLEEHIRERISLGQLPIVEVDGFYLPDTRGTSYRRDHAKTTIAVNRIDVGTRSLEYFHNEGCFRLTGADFDGLLGRQTGVTPTSTPTLPPYFEFAKFNAHQNSGGAGTSRHRSASSSFGAHPRDQSIQAVRVLSERDRSKDRRLPKPISPDCIRHDAAGRSELRASGLPSRLDREEQWAAR